MDKNRYLDLATKGSGLTESETDAGWHFCPDWDGMLIGPGQPCRSQRYTEP